MTHIQQALGKQKIYAKLLLRGSRDGKSESVFHSLCDNKGPLLSLIKTNKDILCGGFSSIDWKQNDTWGIDKKCFIYSLKLKKVYPRKNDELNLYFGKDYGPNYGHCGSLRLYKGKLYSECNYDPFQVPKNAEGNHEITEESNKENEFKDYEVFAITTE